MGVGGQGRCECISEVFCKTSKNIYIWGLGVGEGRVMGVGLVGGSGWM